GGTWIRRRTGWVNSGAMPRGSRWSNPGLAPGVSETGPLMNRTEALQLMHEHTKSASLRQHMLAVEAAMRAYARQRGEDAEAWGIVGLLHDFDYEKFPNAEHSPSEGHPSWGCACYVRKGCPRRCAARFSGMATTPAWRATRRSRRRCSRWTSCAGPWWHARWCGRPGASRISRYRR